MHPPCLAVPQYQQRRHQRRKGDAASEEDQPRCEFERQAGDGLRHDGQGGILVAPDRQQGDCEDYSLLKMKTLLDAGFPPTNSPYPWSSTATAATTSLPRPPEVGRLRARQPLGQRQALSSTGYTFLASQNFNNKSAWQVTLAGPRAAQFSGMNGLCTEIAGIPLRARRHRVSHCKSPGTFARA